MAATRNNCIPWMGSICRNWVALKGFLQNGETIKLEIKSVPSILGGIIVSIGDKYVDKDEDSKTHQDNQRF